MHLGGGRGGIVLHSTYCEGDKIMTNEVGGTCGFVGEKRGAYKILMRKPENT